MKKKRRWCKPINAKCFRIIYRKLTNDCASCAVADSKRDSLWLKKIEKRKLNQNMSA